VQLAPANAQHRTTLAIALDSVGRAEEAFKTLDSAAAEGVADADDLLRTAIQIGLKLRLYKQTLKHAEALAVLQPGNPQLEALVRQLRSIVKTGK